MNKIIYHIYSGTSGNSGLYLDEIYQILKKEGFKQRVFVSYFYPFAYGEKVFFRFGDIAHSKFRGRLRKVIQLIEIIIAYIKILVYSSIEKPKIVNYSHIGQSYFFIYYFLVLLKRITGAKLIITCHDVKPHKIISGEIKFRRLIFELGDYLLVHNDNSINDLNTIFSIETDKIIKHPFPIMDLTKLNYLDTTFNPCDFLFIGHLRKNKGIEFLLNTWKDFSSIYPEAKLCVCGNTTSDVSFDVEELIPHNVDFHLKYISDQEYYMYIKSARFVILPYFEGTNSGIISTVLSMGVNVVTSDIPMFKENQFICDSDMFKSHDKQSLISILEKKYLEHNDSTGFDKIRKYRNDFDKSVKQVYTKILGNIV